MNDLSFRTEFKSQKYNSHFKFESDSKIYFPISTQQHEKYIENILNRLNNNITPFQYENNQNNNIEEEKKIVKTHLIIVFIVKSQNQIKTT